MKTILFTSLDQQMLLGYKLIQEQKLEDAVQVWIKVYQEIRNYMKQEQISSLEDFDTLFEGTEFVVNWIVDFSDAFYHLCSSNKERFIDGYKDIQLAFLMFVLSALKNSDANYLFFLRAQAEAYVNTGDVQKGDELFKQLIHNHPDYLWGYIGYADAYYYIETEHQDFDKALRILMSAYHNKNIAKDRDVLLERIIEVQNFLIHSESNLNLVEKLKTEKKKMEQELKELIHQPKHSKVPIIKDATTNVKVGRNDPCPCGSGIKYKKCCYLKK